MLSENAERNSGKGQEPPPLEVGGAVHRVTFLPGREEFDAYAEEDLLTAALRHRVPVMYGCRHGNCGTCLHYLVEGDVAEGDTSPYVLTSDRREQGAVLLCSSFARSPVVIECSEVEILLDDGEVIPPEVRIARVVATSSLSPSLIELRLHLRKPLRFWAGQYVEIWVPGTDLRRSLSIASPPSNPTELIFVLAIRPGGAFSQAAAGLRPGDLLRLRGPFGHFRASNAGRPVVMVALGSGIAPLMSILRQSEGCPSLPAISLYYGGPLEERAYLEELEHLRATLPDFKLRLAPVPHNGATHIGTLTQLVASELRDGFSHDAYVCGIPQMCDALSALLAAKGMPQQHIRVEKYYPAQAGG